VLSAPRPLAHIIHAYFMASKRVRVVLVQEWLSLAIIMASIATFGRISILWTCGAVGVAFVVRTLLLMWVVERLDGIKMRRFLVPLVRPLAACLLMVGAIIVARPLLGDMAPVARLAIEIAIGAVVYLAGARLIFFDLTKEFFQLLRSAGRK